VAVAGATTVATIAVASGVAAAAPDGPASKAAPPRPAAGAAVDASDATRQLAREKIHLAVLEQDRLAAEARAAARREARRRAAARREARRRAAARRAAELAAARQAQQQQPAGNSASAPATPSGSPQQIAAAMLGSFGWSSGEFGCLQSLWNAESGWNPSASNPISGAYGIPQALPGSKMASAGADWQTNPATQIKWGLGYIKQVYGSPCAAWSHEQSTGWY
jgi:hypothetical protein